MKELWLACASGSRSLAPIYKRNPAKNPKYITSKLFGIANKNVDKTPRIGAVASRSKSNIAFLVVFLWVSMRVTVFSPSEKS